MITGFHYITDNDIELVLDLSKDYSSGIDMLEGVNHPTRTKYFTALSKGIKWLVGEKEYTLIDAGMNITGFVTPDHTMMVVVYPYDHPQYSSPGNAVIYNEDGTVYKQLSCPKPVSVLAKGKNIVMDARGSMLLFFGGVVWDRNQKNEVVMAVNIGFELEYYERRELNYITGEYGACLRSWRQ